MAKKQAKKQAKVKARTKPEIFLRRRNYAKGAYHPETWKDGHPEFWYGVAEIEAHVFWPRSRGTGSIVVPDDNFMFRVHTDKRYKTAEAAYRAAKRLYIPKQFGAVAVRTVRK